jgi:predicted anti-sigma-YlaC factor YlaD
MNPLFALFLVLALTGCSLRQAAVDRLADAIAGGGATYASDDDPELVRAAAPFSLKLTESLLAETPRHKALLAAAARGFTQYAYAFVQQEADELEETDIARAAALQERARRLYRRARDYGMRGLALGEDAELLYWTSAAWASYIGLSKNDPEALADLPLVERMIDRALALDEGYERGAIHAFLISYEMVRQGTPGDAAQRARRHFERAVELSGGADAAPFVALAEAVSLPAQRRREFEYLLDRALQIDAAGNRLANLVMQRRARWLRSRADRLFTD